MVDLSWNKDKLWLVKTHRSVEYFGFCYVSGNVDVQYINILSKIVPEQNSSSNISTNML